MKKIIFLIVLTFSFNLTVKAEKIEVSLDKCVDGDTAWFILNNESFKARFLAINTPEYTTKIEPFGKEASEFTCDSLKNAKKIEIEYDPKSDKKDKYERDLVWVFVDNELLQNKLVLNGLADVKYVYDDYLYVSTLNKSLKDAKKNKVGMWKDYEYVDYTPLVISISIITLLCLLLTCIIRKK